MDAIKRMQEAVNELADELAHADRLVDEQAHRIKSLEAEVALLRHVFGSAAA